MQKIFLLFLIWLPLITSAQVQKGWWNADRSSLGIAPTPKNERRAVVQIYTARAYGWRGNFAIHPWISIKEKDAPNFSTYEVMGFSSQQGKPVIRKRNTAPDLRWYGNDPEIILDIRGEAAEEMIPDIEKAIGSYPYPETYRLFPGPNSNTFISYIMRNTTGIYIELPPHAIGKDWIGKAQLFGVTESGTGAQFSLFGLFGITVGLAEGIEINILGLSFGIDFWMPAIKLPFVGRLGFKDRPVFEKAEAKNSEASDAESNSWKKNIFQK